MKYTELKAQGDVATSVAANTLLMVCSTPDTDPQSKVITFHDFINSVNRPGANQVSLVPNITPANSTAVVSKGVMFFDTEYLYIATADNTLKRVSLTSF